jgi:hypothetical protein
MLLQENNLVANSSEPDDCAYLYNAVGAWLLGTSGKEQDYSVFGARRELDAYVLWAQLMPVRCDWQREDGVITLCSWTCDEDEHICTACSLWNRTYLPPDEATPERFADVLGVRVGGILEYKLEAYAPLSDQGQVVNQSYSVKVIVNESDTLTYSYVPTLLP